MTKPVVIVLVVLAAIVVLFVVGVGAGVTGSEGSARNEASDPPGFLDVLGDVAGDRVAVTLDELATDCAVDGDPTELSFVGSCSITVEQSDARFRLLRLRTILGPVTFDAPAPDPRIRGFDDEDLKIGKVNGIPVGPHGAGDPGADVPAEPIRLHCQQAVACTVEIVDAG